AMIGRSYLQQRIDETRAAACSDADEYAGVLASVHGNAESSGDWMLRQNIHNLLFGITDPYPDPDEAVARLLAVPLDSRGRSDELIQANDNDQLSTREWLRILKSECPTFASQT